MARGSRSMPAAVAALLQATALLLSLGPGLAQPSAAQTDEIQVYDASIAEPGATELTLHANYTPSGRRDADFPGGVVAEHSLNGTLEFAHGVRDWLELGLYLPVYTIGEGASPRFDGAKLRSLFVVPDAAHRSFFYGINFELSWNASHWDTARWSTEARPIVGWHLSRWDLILNPILDSDLKGLRTVRFAPAERIAFNATERWAFALEHYADVGPLRRFEPWSEQEHSLFAVVDYDPGRGDSFEFGIGHGLTPAADNVVLKLIWNHAL